MRRVLSRLAIALGLVTTASCGSDNFGGQVVVMIDTDAPVPGNDDATAPPQLFDRVRIEVYPPGATSPCASCTRIVALDVATLKSGLSFGVGERAGEGGTRVRAVAYRSLAFPDGDPTIGASIDVTIALPAVQNDETRNVLLFLPTDETGAPATSLDAPRTATTGTGEPSRVGTWPRAQRTTCSGIAHPGQVCVPGGAFWLPSPFADQYSLQAGTPYDEALVVLSPFFIDRTEVTVAQFRDSGFLESALAGKGHLTSWSGDEEGIEPPFELYNDWCTYSGAFGRGEKPINCIEYSVARAYCQSVGGDLPTEAQFAYAQSGLASHRYPWGDGDPTCDDAPWGEGALGNPAGEIGPCSTVADGFIPISAVGSSARDRVALPGGTIEDLAANASEMTRDRYTTTVNPCWTDAIAADPFCDPDQVAGTSTVERGGSFDTVAAAGLSTRWRQGFPVGFGAADVGFRCVRPGDAVDDAPPPEPLAWIATGCQADSDCGGGAGICIGVGAQGAPFGGGAAGGYCTAKCKSNADCGAANRCVSGRCERHCALAKPDIAFTMLDPAKCHGRRDLACSASSLCVPMCGSDSQCEGRHCDPKRGVCTDTVPAGLPDGRSCTADANCLGRCVHYVGGAAICGSVCSLGGEPDSEDCGGRGQCMIADTYDSPGSLGYCVPPCNAHSDCNMPTFFCSNYLNGTMIPDHWNVAAHVCLGAPPCTVPGSACAGGLTCMVSPFGKFCLNSSIPF